MQGTLSGSRPALAVATLVILAIAAPAYAGFETTVTKATGFDAAALSRLVLVFTECHEVVDCSRVLQQVEAGAAREKAWTLVPEATVRQFLFSRGATAYTSEERAAVAEHFEASAVMELRMPFAERGDGYGGRRGSQVKVELTLFAPTGEVLAHAVGTGRPVNVVTSPERVAGNVVEEILRKLFE